MRSNCSVFVDAGYLLSSAATRVTGTSLRNGINVRYRALVEALIAQSEQISGLPLLRVHWYDSARNGIPDVQQERIGELPKVKLRLGRFGVDGQQKGVDLRIGLDLVTHARNGAADVFVLVSGDDDLTEAVEEAQTHGVQVVVLAVPNAAGKPHGLSRHLVRAADELALLESSVIDETIAKIEVPKPEPPAATAPAATGASGTSSPANATPLLVAGHARPGGGKPAVGSAAAVSTPVSRPTTALAYSGSTGGESRIAPGYEDADTYDDEIDSVVARLVESIRQTVTVHEEADLLRGRPSIPRDIDRALLQDLSDRLGVYDLSDPVRFRLRERFWARWDELSR